MDIGRPRRIIEVEPVTRPVPGPLPAPEPAPETEPLLPQQAEPQG